MKNRVCALVAEKKIFLLLLLVCSTVMMFADGLTATLQRGETMTAYFGQSALTEAYEAAADGDVITLSPGGFNPVTEIKKSVRIVGAYGVTNESYATFLNAAFTVNADNVKLEGMYFQGNVTLADITNCTIKRCYIGNLYQSGTHTNTLIDQCVLKADYAVKTGVNYGIKNSTIQYFADMNTPANVANVTNCLVYVFYSARNSTLSQPFAIYKNNILQIENDNSYNAEYSNNVSLSSPSEFYYNYFNSVKPNMNSSTAPIRRYFYTTPNFTLGCINIGNMTNISGSQGYNYPSAISGNTYPNAETCSANGQDGTPLGITGGEGFNEYPGIPRVLTANIDAQTDDKGKLNASITVKVEK